VIEAIQRRRARARAQRADGLILIAVACHGDECPDPRSWAPWACGRRDAKRPRAARCPCRDIRAPEPAARRAQREARRAGGDASWTCRGRVRRWPHGRHRRC
jgi:hypothetical protein